MDQVFETTQNMEFASRVLPDLFHGAPDLFLFYLNRDGTKFLNFYWNEAGRRLDRSAAAFGMSYDIRSPLPQVTIALVRMPGEPQEGEAHLAALCYRPARQGPLFGLNDISTVLVLEGAPAGATRLVEITRRRRRAELGPGPAPTLDDFYRAVLTEIGN